jgi:hypothetical protein
MQSSCRPAAASPRDRSSATEQTRNPSAGSGKSAGDTETCITALIFVAHSNPVVQDFNAASGSPIQILYLLYLKKNPKLAEAVLRIRNILVSTDPDPPIPVSD